MAGLWSGALLAAAAAAAPVAGTPEHTLAAVQAVAREQLEAQADREGLAEPLVEASVVASGRPLPVCARGVEVEGLDTRYPSRMRFAAVCPTRDGVPGWRQELVVRASVSARVVVAAADVPAGRPLAASELLLERRGLQTVSDAVSDLQAVAGMTSRRALHAGDVVRKSFLVAAQLVRRGGTVRIVVRSGPIEVTLSGEALDAGAQGDIVRVRNASGKTVRARVVGDSTVEPVDMPVAPPTQSTD